MSAKNKIDWRFSGRSVYCYGAKQSMQMPCRIVFCHKTRRTFYGFINVRNALNFLNERVTAVNSVKCVFKDGQYYHFFNGIILVTPRPVDALLSWQYDCPVI